MTVIKAFTCEWPGCERSFSVRSNMLRHWRSHERSDVSHYATAVGQRDGDDEDDLDEEYSRGNASKGQQNSSSYYTVSRRR